MLSVVDIKKGQHIIKKGTKLTYIFWLIKGSVRLETEHAEVILKGGNVLGMPDCLGNTFKYDYVAVEDGKLYAIPYQSPEDLSAIYHEKNNYGPVFLMAVMNTASQVAQSINQELSDMKDLRNDPEFPNTPEPFRQNYYLAYKKQALDKIDAFFKDNEVLMTGAIMTAAKYLTRAVPALDLLEQFRQNSEQMNPPAPEPVVIEEEELFEDTGESLLSEDPLQEILEFAEFPKEKRREITDLITQYKMLPDPNDTDDATRALRRALTNAFYETYKAVFFNIIGQTGVSPTITMFLNFGYMDLDFCGRENAEKLLKVAENLTKITSRRVYTLPQWLLSIYGGKNEPSKNEFDMDFEHFLRDEKKNGRMTDREIEAFRRNGKKKAEFEIDNMMKNNGRTTCGRVLTFCPVLSGDDLVRGIDKLLIKAKDLEAAINKIKETDYSLFYHDEQFSDPEHGINVETVKTEIMPNIILMPNFGTRFMMWQETSGLRSNTPSRFVLPILFDGDLEEQMLLTCGRYRWEFCRRVEGARWNDVTADSLTARYCDYLQFYRKNRELTPEIREKLQLTLKRCKNNYREVFVLDYLIWMRYETRGSMRLNRVTREFMMKYCPMSKACRDALANNPNFSQRLQRQITQLEKDKKRMTTLIERYSDKGGSNLEPLMRMLDYYEL